VKVVTCEIAARELKRAVTYMVIKILVGIELILTTINNSDSLYIG